MGNSTLSVQTVYDTIKAKGIPVPMDQPTGYGVDLAIDMANDVMSEIVAERFNWKWNRTASPAFYTNSFQQDYPQIGLTNIAWLEDADRIDINNTSLPKPIKQLTARRQLSRSSSSYIPVSEICWFYNSELVFGTWPGAGIVYSPLITTQVKQNPIMSMIDANGNLLILTTFGTTGGSAPVLAANSAEGTTVADGGCVWTVVSPNSQGFRVHPLPGASGPVWQIIPYYQIILQKMLNLQAKINPIPDEYSRIFKEGLRIACLMGSTNPEDQKRGEREHPLWLKALQDSRKQGDREADAYALLPANSPVDSVYGWDRRNPQDPSQPY